MSKPLSAYADKQVVENTSARQALTLNANECMQYSTEQQIPASLKPLSKRLDHLYTWANRHADLAKPYDAIWDICCDHGLLGLHLHAANPCTHVHLVDCVPSIIEALKSRYRSRFDQRLSVACIDAAAIDVPASVSGLMVIAGVSGTTIIHIISGILSRWQPGCATATMDFLLSPNGAVLELRAYLNARSFELIDEQLVCEKGRAHEHLLLRYRADNLSPVSPCALIGSRIWRELNTEKRAYIESRIRYHQSRCIHKNKPEALELIKLYSSLLK